MPRHQVDRLAYLMLIVIACGMGAGSTSRAMGNTVSVSGRVLTEPGGIGAAQQKVILWNHRNGRRQDTKTDRLGEFVFDHVEASAYTLRVVARPVGIWSEGVVVSIRDRSVISDDLFLTLPQWVAGTVRDIETDEPVTGVEINFSTAERNRNEVVTDANGQYKLFVTARVVDLRCDGSSDRYYPETDKISLTVAEGHALEHIDFVVRSARQYRGQVIMPTGEPVADLPILANVHWSCATVSNLKRIEEARRKWRKTVPYEKREAKSPPKQPSSLIDGAGIGNTFRLKTDRQGHFLGYMRRWIRRDWDEAIDVIVIARLPDHSMGAMAVRKWTTIHPEFSPIQVTLLPTATANFTIVDPNGQPINEAKPQVASWLFDYIFMSDAPQDAEPKFKSLGEGRYRATGLIPGWDYEVFAQVAGYKCPQGLRVLAKQGENVDAGILHLQLNTLEP